MRRQHRGHWRALTLVALWLCSLGGPGAAQAAQAVTKVRVTGPECEALVAASGRPASKVCFVIVERGGTTSRGSTGDSAAAPTATGSCYVPSGYTHCGSTWVRTTSILLVWSVTSTATFVRNATTGKVAWTSVTCTQQAFGYVVTIRWCGSWHSGDPDTNYGANFDVGFVWEGSPLTVSHGHRAAINGRTGVECCLQNW